MTDDQSQHAEAAREPARSYDAFISYASANRDKALSICESLEERGLRCWIAPRDVAPGAEYGEEIVRGIRDSRCLVLVLSDAANASSMVRREVERAVSMNKPVFPVRIEEVLPAKSLEFFISATHWVDAWEGRLVDHAMRLADELSDERFIEEVAIGLRARKRRRRLLRRVSFSGVLLAVLVVAVTIALLRPSGGAGEASDPVAAEAANQGLDIDDVEARDFEIGVGRRYGMVVLHVDSSDAIEAMIARGLLEYRVGGRAWQQVFGEAGGEGYYGMLSPGDLASDGPIELQFAGHSDGASVIAHGPYEFEGRPLDMLREWERARATENREWIQFGLTGWDVDHTYFLETSRVVGRVHVGRESRDLAVSQEIPLPETEGAGIEIGSTTAMVLGMVASELKNKITALQTSEVFVQVEFRDGTRSEVFSVEADDAAVARVRAQTPWAAPALDRNPDDIFEVITAADFQPGRLSNVRVTLFNLGVARKHLSHVLVRRADGESNRRFEVVAAADTSGLNTRYGEQVIIYAESGANYQYRGDVQVPTHWESVIVEAVLRDGRSVTYTIEAESQPPSLGFRATAIGERASEAPALYLSCNRNLNNRRTQFVIFPWIDVEQQTMPTQSVYLVHVDDVFEFEAQSPAGETRTYTYRAEGLKTLAEYLPVDPEMRMIEAQTIVELSVPANSVGVSADGGVFAVRDARGTLHLVERSEDEARATIEGVNAFLLSADGSRVVTSRSTSGSRRGETAWEVFDTSSGAAIGALGQPADSRLRLHGDLTPIGPGDMFTFRYPTDARSRADSGTIFRVESGLWSLRDGSLLLGREEGSAYVLGATADGSRAVSISRDRLSVLIFDITAGSPSLVRRVDYDAPISGAVMSPDGSSVALLWGESQALRVLSVPDLTERFEAYSRGGGGVAVPAYTRDGKAVLTRPALSDRDFELLDAQSGESLYQVPQAGEGIVSPGIAWRGRGLGYSDNQLVDMTSGEEIDYLPVAGGFSRGGPFSGGSHDFLLYNTASPGVGETQEIYFTDMRSKMSIRLNVAEGKSCTEFRASRVGDLLAAVRSDGAAVYWQTR